MASQTLLHALGLHLYQPTGNLRALLNENASELRRILLCYERLGRHAHKYADVARLHVAISPILLDQLRDPELIEACRDLVDIPSILESWRTSAAIEFVGTGYRHASLALIPREDWADQLHKEREEMETAFGHVLKGYWPPGGLFDTALIPALLKAGYEYLMLPAAGLAMPEDGVVDPYRAYRLCHEGACIPVVPLDEGFSRAQEHGLDAAWFADSVRDGVARSPASDVPYLLSTWSDGENGEWFRCEDEVQGFFGHFFSPYMEFCEVGRFPLQPAFLSEYLRRFPPKTEVVLSRLDGADEVLAADAGLRTLQRRLNEVSARYWKLMELLPRPAVPSQQALSQARELLLSAQDGTLLLGGEPGRDASLRLLARAEELMDAQPARAAVGAQRQAGVKRPRAALSDVESSVTPKPAAASAETAARQKPAASQRKKGSRPKPDETSPAETAARQESAMAPSDTATRRKSADSASRSQRAESSAPAKKLPRKRSPARQTGKSEAAAKSNVGKTRKPPSVE